MEDDTIEAKETYYRGKRDLQQNARHNTLATQYSSTAAMEDDTIEAKETYYRGKRDLQQNARHNTLATH